MQDKLKVIIYGAGNFLKESYDIIPDEWEIKAIADKNQELWGINIFGYKVISPDDINNYDYDVVVIMSYIYSREIAKNLQDRGIDTWRIINGGKFYDKWDRGLHYIDITKKYLRISRCKTVFENRKTNSNKLLYILIGYKEFLWKDTLNRVKAFCPKDIDVCLLSSGKYVQQLSDIAKTNGWSYFSTSVNNILDAQNLLLAVFSEKDMIFKMDEDVYVTRNCFSKLLSGYEYASKVGESKIGYISPLIPLNSSSYYFLDEFNLKDSYKQHFNRNLLFGGDIASPDIRTNADFAKFYWSVGNVDVLNYQAEKKGKKRMRYVSGRHAICFILFSREFYNSMGGFLPDELNGKGYDWKDGDEFQIMQHCINFGFSGIILLDTVCGHFCYAAQEKDMIEYREKKSEYFEIQNIGDDVDE